MRRLAFVALAVAVVSPSSSTPATGQTPPLTATFVAPLDGAKVAVERVAGFYAGDQQRWRLNMDIWVKNGARRTYRLVESEVCYTNAPVTCRSKTPPSTVTVAAGKSIVVQAPEDRDHPFPVAPVARVVLKFTATDGSGDTAVIVNRSLAEWRNRVAGGGYLFPGKRSDLPDGWYWTDGQNHVFGSNHRNSTSQRFAYDLVVRRWNGKEWTSYKQGKSGKANSDSLIWDLPVYAMADGWILRCNRTVAENSKPGVKGTGGGNSYRIVHANGEVMLYAHLRKDSIPEELCPTEGKDYTVRTAPRVRAGDFLGRVGNSGQSSGPHLHLHLGTTGQKGEQGVPILLRNARTRAAGESWNGWKPCDPKAPSFAVSSPPAAVSRRQLIEPLYPSGAPEAARHSLAEPCFQDVGDQLVASGYRPVWLDGYDVDGKAYVNTVFRPGGGSWVLRHNLSASAYQSELTAWLDKGYVPSLVESYRIGDSLRFAFLAEKRPNPGIGAYHGRSQADHQKLANDYKAQGFAPISVAVVSLKGKLYYTALWEKRSVGTWSMSSQLTAAGYQKFLEDNAKANRRLVYVNAYHHDGKPMFAAVVTSKASKSYAARHDLTTQGYQAEYEKWTRSGLRTQVVTGYRSGSSHRFAGLWR
jgi:murein DD-endopeptidase MepM/ murein hydrolase activator NlpD